MKENLSNWRDKIKKVSQSKRNLFSQKDSEAQFINQIDDDEDEDDDDNEYADDGSSSGLDGQFD